jgi:Ca-activated chloride channel family protein
METFVTDLPFTADRLQFALLPSLFTLFFIPFSLFIFLKKRPGGSFYTFSLADFSTTLTQDKLFQIEDRLSFLHLLTLVILSIGFACPALLTQETLKEVLEQRELPPKEGSALFLLLDQSGSMGRQVAIDPVKKERLIDYLKELSKDFIHSLDKDNPPERKDLIGLMGFARYAYVIIPPTFEHDILDQAIDRFDVLTSKEGEGTSLSYAIYKTAHLIQFLQQQTKNTDYHLENAAIVLITDGVETINPEDVNKQYVSISMDAASAYAASQHIPLYLLIIYPELKLDSYAPQRKSLQKAADMTKGGLYILDQPKDVASALQHIAQLKKAQLGFQAPSPAVKSTPLWPYFLWSGLALFLFYVYLQFYIYRIAP